MRERTKTVPIDNQKPVLDNLGNRIAFDLTAIRTLYDDKKRNFRAPDCFCPIEPTGFIV